MINIKICLKHWAAFFILMKDLHFEFVHNISLVNANDQPVEWTILKERVMHPRSKDTLIDVATAKILNTLPTPMKELLLSIIPITLFLFLITSLFQIKSLIKSTNLIRLIKIYPRSKDTLRDVATTKILNTPLTLIKDYYL